MSTTNDAQITHGFVEELLGDDRPPATHYHLSPEASGFYAEFMTPLTGSRYDRTGRSKATVEIGGVGSRRLRHIELLLNHPWSVDFDSSNFKTKIHIANPVSFVAQKGLIHNERAREDRSKAILYIHDTIEVFGGRLGDLKELWQKTVAPQLYADHAKSVSRAVKTIFGKVSDAFRRTAQIDGERRLSPAMIREACEYGFIEVFG